MIWGETLTELKIEVTCRKKQQTGTPPSEIFSDFFKTNYWWVTNFRIFLRAKLELGCWRPFFSYRTFVGSSEKLQQQKWSSDSEDWHQDTSVSSRWVSTTESSDLLPLSSCFNCLICMLQIFSPKCIVRHILSPCSWDVCIIIIHSDPESTDKSIHWVKVNVWITICLFMLLL